MTLFILFYSFVGIQAQVIHEKYIEFGIPVIIKHTSEPTVSRYPFAVGPFTTIDVNSLVTQKRKASFLRYESSFGFSAGHRITSEKSNFINIQFGYAQYSLKSSEQTLRFSDMVDPLRGFVNPSFYSVEKLAYAFRLVNLDISGGTALNGKKFLHSFSCGLRSSILTQSKYMGELKHGKTGQKKFTYQKDLRFTDGVFNCSPFFQYDVTPQIAKGRTKYSLLVTDMNLLYRLNSVYPSASNDKTFRRKNNLFIARISVSRVLRRVERD
ncbi:MAG: hypothetical protein GC181_14435 [Bacteroidetes bacterium]|nr:hypothetical protein [Bacteroidota bacterium]